MEQPYKYDAFVSYRHIVPDKPIAERLQNLLETYVPPQEITQETSGDKKQSRLHLFLDESELPTSSNLGEDIKAALEQSRFLIIVCSNNYQKSKWCMQELEYFKALHNGTNDNILMLWVGEPNEPPSIPEALRFEKKMVLDQEGNERVELEEVEPLAANVSAATLQQSLKKLKTEFLRIAAPLLGCGYDDLFRREQRRQKKRSRIVLTSIIAGLAIIALASTSALITISSQKRQIEEDKLSLEIGHANLLLKESKELEQSGDAYGALDAIVQAFPEEESNVPLLNGVVEQAAKLCGAFSPSIFTSTTRIELPAEVEDMCLFEDGTRLVTVDKYNTYLWDTETGECIKGFPGCDEYEVAFFIDREIDNISFEWITKGSLAFRKSGGQNVTLGLEKLIDKEVSPHGCALYLVDSGDEEGSIVCKISPNDGTPIWSKAYADNAMIEAVSTEGVIVVENDRIEVLSPETGKKQAEININEIREKCGTDRFLFNYEYCEERLIVTWVESGKVSFGVFKKEKESFNFIYKQSFDSEGGAVVDLLVDENTIYYAGEVFDDVLFVTPVVKAFDLQDGSLKWSCEEEHEFGGNVFMALFKDVEIKQKAQNYLVTIIGELFILIDADTGEVRKRYKFEDDFQEIYYSPNGRICVINSNGDELAFYITMVEDVNEDYAFFLNRELKGELNLASYSSNCYAVAFEDKKAVSVFRTIENKKKNTVYMRDPEEGKSFSDVVLNPNGTLVAVTQYSPDRIIILDAETHQQIQTIETESVCDCWFLGEEKLVIYDYDSLSILDCYTGEVVKTMSKDDIAGAFYINPEKEEILYKDYNNGDLTVISSTLEEAIIIDGNESKKGTDDIKDRSLSDYYPSTSFEKILIRFHDSEFTNAVVSQEKEGTITLDYNTFESRYVYSVYDRNNNSFTDLIMEEEIPYIKSCVWSADEKIVYLLTDKDESNYTLHAYDVGTGSKVFETVLGRETKDIIMVKDELCILNEAGTLEKVRYSEDGLVTEGIIELGSRPAPTYLQVESIPGGQYVMVSSKSSPHRAWLIDLEEFEIVYSIEGYCDYIPKTNSILTEYYNTIYAYPFLKPEDVNARVRELMLS